MHEVCGLLRRHGNGWSFHCIGTERARRGWGLELRQLLEVHGSLPSRGGYLWVHDEKEEKRGEKVQDDFCVSFRRVAGVGWHG